VLRDGRLTLTGPSKDSILVSGIHYFSQELDVVLERLDGVQPATVAAFATRSTAADTELLAVTFVPDRGSRQVRCTVC
jgi:hypothetical protein